jgi:anti-sigma factor RsiW
MKLNESQLLAYVNGELPARECNEIEQAVRTLPDVARQVELLRASRLPYQAAFARQKLPPVPAHLARKIAGMAREAAQKNTKAKAGANDPVMPHLAGLAAFERVRSWLRVAPAWLAVAFFSGVFVCGVVLRLVPQVAPATRVGISMANEGVRPWVVAAAGYQQLYWRATLEHVDGDTELSKKTLEDIRKLDGLALMIPDLRAVGLTFKRVQRLRFNGSALVQIVYLPEQGAPVALCVMKERKPKEAVAEQRIDTMNVVTWRQSELGYALIGKPGDADLTAIAKRISGNLVDPLFTDGALPFIDAFHHLPASQH